MYNGIGLNTPRGSGTSGYVQRNVASIRNRREKVQYKTDAELARLDRELQKKPNREILEHEWKRNIEVRCLQLQEELEEQGQSEKEIEEQVGNLRDFLTKEGYSGLPLGSSQATHQVAEATEKKKQQLKSAFGIREDYVEGSAFDPVKQAMRAAQLKAEREEALESKRKKKQVKKDSSPELSEESSEDSDSSSSSEEEQHKKKRRWAV